MIRISFHFSIRVYTGTAEGKNKIVRKQEGQPSAAFSDIISQAIDRLIPTRSKSTIDNYRMALRSLKEYAKGELSVRYFNRQTVEGWEQWLKQKGVKLNTISCYMRSLKSVVSSLDGELSTLRTAFDNVFKGHTATSKRAITKEDLGRLMRMKLPEKSPLRLARDLFLFSLYALGMPFVDVAFLRKDQIADGYISYQRRKTRQPVRVKVEPQMQCIIDRYLRHDSPYVFPILKEGTEAEYEQALNQHNRRLHRLSAVAGLSRRLTSYVARHSWASMAYSENVDLPVISKAFGHTNTKTTMVYIRGIDDQRIDQANHRLLSLIDKVAMPTSGAEVGKAEAKE